MAETVLEFENNRHLIELCGAHDRHLAMLEQGFEVAILRKGNVIVVRGDSPGPERAAEAMSELYTRIEQGRSIDEGDVDASVRLSAQIDQPDLFRAERLEIRTKRKTIEPRTPGQQDYVRQLFQKELVFGVGPAGSGKTFLAVATGLAMLQEGRVDKLILSRPAVEAGERLGFLPGDANEKVDPYLRPLYDAIDTMWGVSPEKLREDRRFEVAPLAFMRGRTLSNAFVVLDEAQNTTEMQMKMFLTRLGENSRMVITGDPSQVDLPRGVRSGLKDALGVLKNVPEIGICRLTETDVVRHPLVARIVGAYAKKESARDRAKDGGEAEAE